MSKLRNDRVEDVLAASVTEFFDSYGVSCSRGDLATTSDSEESAELGSMVGFRGRKLRGGLAFVAPVSLVAGLLPIPASAVHTDGQLRDWSAEIANQLLGRLKNKLATRLFDFDVGTPVCFTGKSIRLVFLPGADGVSLLFHVGNAVVRIHLDCSLSVDLTVGNVEALRIVPEGDVLIF